MAYEPEVSIITGRISDIGQRYIYVLPGVRVVLLPAIDMSKLEVGLKVTVRAVRRHGQFVAESISVDRTPGEVASSGSA